MKRALACVMSLCVLGGGCRDHQQAAADKVTQVVGLAETIASDAVDSRTALQGLLEEGGVVAGWEPVVEETQGRLSRIEANADSIKATGMSVLTQDITKLENPKSLLEKLLPVLRVWGWVVALALVIGLLAYCGGLRILRTLLHGVGSALVRIVGPKAAPRQVREAAQLDAEALAATPDNHALQTKIAVARTQDRRYDAVFVAKKDELKEIGLWKASGISLNSTSGRTSSPSSASATSAAGLSSLSSNDSGSGSSASSPAVSKGEGLGGGHDAGDEA